MAAVCDFCRDTLTTPWWEYMADDFTLETLSLGEEMELSSIVFEGSWLACTKCHDAIDAKDIDRLSQRMADAIEKHVIKQAVTPDERQFHVELALRIYEAFDESRVGQPGMHDEVQD